MQRQNLIPSSLPRAHSSTSSISNVVQDGHPSKKRRVRIPKSCIPCLKGKRACDRERPACGRCVRSGQPNDCNYDPRLTEKSSTSPASSFKLNCSQDASDVDSDENDQIATLKAELEKYKREMSKLKLMIESRSKTCNRHSNTQDDRDALSGLQMLANVTSPDSHLKLDIQTSHESDGHRPIQRNPSTSSDTCQSGYNHSNHARSSQDHKPHLVSSKPLPFDALTSTGCVNSRPHSNQVGTPVNKNGTLIYYGEGLSGDTVLRKFGVDSSIAPKTPNPFSGSNQAPQLQAQHDQVAAIKNDVQIAFNGLLDPSRDSFPFATIWSSGNGFISELLAIFPKPQEFDTLCQSFVRHFSAMCPALTVPYAINYARDFSRLSSEQQANVPLPWIAVFLMICAMGTNCNLENSPVPFEPQNHILGDSGARESLPVSKTLSPSPRANTKANPQLQALTSALQEYKGCWTPAMLSDLYLSATYQSLRLCSFLSSPTLQTIHAQLLIGAYLVNTERAASFWPLLGSIARQAQSIGLHLDPDLIRSDWDPVEADIRRRLWWAVVHQDVILSGIFGRPLGITRFNCKFPGQPENLTRTFATLQCELSQFSRTYLDENGDGRWSQEQIDNYTEKVLDWYAEIPQQYRAECGLVDTFGSEREQEAIQNYRAAGVDLNTKGLMEVHQSCNLAIEVFYTLLSLHRSNLLPKRVNQPCQKQKSSDSPPSSSQTSRSQTKVKDEDGQNDQVNEKSLRICAQALRRITRAQQIMTDILGRPRASLFWKVSYYTFQAAVGGAYITFLSPHSPFAQSALEDLTILTDIFDRMPERWTGLKMAKGGLNVLRKLAIAARENPKAASMSRNLPANQPSAALTPLPLMASSDPLGGKGSLSPAPFGMSGTADGGNFFNQVPGQTCSNSKKPSANPLYNQMYVPGSSTPFMHPIMPSSHPRTNTSILPFMDDNAAIEGQSSFDVFMGPVSSSPNDSRPPKTGTHAISRSALAGMSSTAAVGPDRSPHFDNGNPSLVPFPHTRPETSSIDMSISSIIQSSVIPSATSNSGNTNQLLPESLYSPSSTTSTNSMMHIVNNPTTAASSHSGNSTLSSYQPYSSTTQAPIFVNSPLFSTNQMQNDPDFTQTAQPNQKDIANYWSEYFSLQIDWDRLTSLI